MATETTNFGLMKPDQEDFYNVSVANTNMDILDTELAKRPAVDEETGKLPDSVLPLSTAATKATPVDADSLALVDSADSNNIKRLLWSQVKAVLGAVFAPLLHCHGDLSSNGQIGGVALDGSLVRMVNGALETLDGEAYFSATLTVTTNPGATVTAVSGSVTYTGKASAVGTALLIINHPGTYTVTSSLSGQTEESSIAITANGDAYALSLILLSTTLNANTWAKIREVSDAGTAANYWSVGDVKTITINGTVGNTTLSNLFVDLFILSFSHNTSREGINRIHFQMGKINGTPVALVDSNYGNSGSSASYFQMNADNTNTGGWNGSSMRNSLLGNSGTPSSPPAGSLLAALPSDLRAVMKAVTKYSDNTGGGSDTASYVTPTTDYLFLLSEYEYYGNRIYANSAEQNYQAQYSYYQAGNSKIKYKHNAIVAAARDWCRSVSSGNAYAFCLVSNGGSALYDPATISDGVASGLCV